MEDRYITVRKACEITGKTRLTIYDWIDKGILGGFQVVKDKKGSPIVIDYYTIPAFMRKAYESKKRKR